MTEARARWANVSPWLSRLGGTPEDRVVNAATALLVALGLWLRARGYFWDPSAFWVDECQWAILLMDEPLVDLLIRPPGFMAVSKVVAMIFGPTEMALRTLPFIAGVAAVAFAPFLAGRLFVASPARLLFVAVIALHPCAVSFAKEFKPYEVSLTLHLALVWLALRYAETLRNGDLAWVLAVAFLGCPFAQDLVFGYPGVFLVIGWKAFKHHRRHFLAVALSAGAIVTVLALQYVFIWSRLTAEDSDFWADKYGVFYTESAGTYFEWLSKRYQGVAAFPGYHMKFWEAQWLSENQWSGLQDVAVVVWVVLHVVGIASLIFRRRLREVLLLVLPIGLVWLFNLAGFWPFGVFRANLFLIGYTAAIAAMAVDRPRKRWRAVTSLIPAALLVVIPILLFERGWGPTKRALTYVSRFPETVAWLAEQPAAKDGPKLIVVDRKSCDPWRYYVAYNPQTRHLRPELERRYRMQCAPDDSRLSDVMDEALGSSERPIWILFNIRAKTKPVLQDLRRRAEITARTSAARHIVYALGGPAKKGRRAVEELPRDVQGPEDAVVPQ